jgi:hypothetical protein
MTMLLVITWLIRKKWYCENINDVIRHHHDRIATSLDSCPIVIELLTAEARRGSPSIPLPPSMESSHTKFKKKLGSVDYIHYESWDVSWMIWNSSAPQNKLYSKFAKILLWEWTVAE